MDFRDAAVIRGREIAQRSHRPRQRRSAELGAGYAASAPLARLDIRMPTETDASIGFDGVASVTGRGYEMWDMWGPYTEVVSAGAFADSLSLSSLDVPLVIAHDQTRRIARTTNGTLQLDETDAGLEVRAQLDPTDADVNYIVPKMRAGLIDEMSFAFRIDSGEWSEDFTEYHIRSANIHRGDVAIVGYGANPYTSANVRTSSADEIKRAVTLTSIKTTLALIN